ncbi:DUF3604 domain-containing protein [Endozoicomonas sp. OPT23]|uniref:DUF3604 domain-containing protein n=1 Tax=Endozoicomonas sp. OPT23 TaxID=2072845 RepID=UPI0018919B9B|nr:DUF3604 domain-containing protein [Endozoicomonas sp. OPT23]
MKTLVKRLLKYTFILLAFGSVAGFFWLDHQLQKAIPDDEYHAYINQPAKPPSYADSKHVSCQDQNKDKNAYFGALHIHTGFSGDAAGWGNQTTPVDAYKFARGDTIKPEFRLGDLSSPEVTIDRPLDFAAVTDHAEYLGEAYLCSTPGTQAYDTLICSVFRGDTQLPLGEAAQPLIRMASMVMFDERSALLCGENGMGCLKGVNHQWLRTQQAAEEAYDRSDACNFTSFVGYEYSLKEKASNMHRNVIYANGTVPPIPLSAREVQKPEQLWEWLDNNCLEADGNCDALVIPHNSNWSSGRMFYPYRLTEYSEKDKQRYAMLRNKVERLVEIMQIKGDSECRNGLSGIMGMPDELCDFEKLRNYQEETEDCGDKKGEGNMKLQGCVSRYSFVRSVLMEGLTEQREVGTNSMKFGIIAASDNHLAIGGAVEEDNYPGHNGGDTTPKDRIGEEINVPGLVKAEPYRYNPGGIAGVWAEENTRESLFSSMKKKETFGTSGPRILPRFFAGWDYKPEMCGNPDMVSRAYASGVAMGGDLPEAPSASSRPSFLLSALMDAKEGATPLQKIQIIKGWTDESGKMYQEIIDVVGDKQPTMSVNTNTCEQTGTGHQSLCGVWQDENFDPNVSAVYYARVVENPSCRWSTYDCNKLSDKEKPAACSDPSVPKTVQERAWTSPVWYEASQG